VRRSPRPLSVLVGVGLVATALAGCSDGAPDDASSDAQSGLQGWTSLMETAITDPEHGRGGAGGSGEGMVTLENVPAGDWDPLLACNGVDGKYFRATAGADVADVLGRTDAPCGATTRMSITVPEPGGLTLRARPLSDAPEAVRRGDVVTYWYVGVVPKGFEAGRRTYDLS